jgi:hypothetical protein
VNSGDPAEPEGKIPLKKNGEKDDEIHREMSLFDKAK